MTTYNNRTHPIFQGTTNTNTVNLGITTRCSMSCPNCSVGIPALQDSGQAKDAVIADIGLAAVMMNPMRRIHVTGGEPTLHHHFEYLSEMMRDWFGAEYMTIETNGVLFRKYKKLLKEKYDLVFITHYVRDNIYPGNFDNTEIIEEARAYLGDKLIVEPPVHHTAKHTEFVPLGFAGTGIKSQAVINQVNDEIRACSKSHDPGLPCAWYNGKLYPCCVSFGISEQFGINLTYDWRDIIVGKAKGCSFCLYKGT